ncbi:MAG: mannose-6-phosphate isomerase, class I [Anaerolineae bacterium]
MKTTFKARPYRMINRIQHYAWGARGKGAFIPQLLGIEAEPGTPYAELWMGAHPKAPSSLLIEGEQVDLRDAIAVQPSFFLGEWVAARFDGALPFLFKVLSAAESLSIQVHPTKPQAERLHARDPEHYPDANHKPEVAVALTGLTALAGFKPGDALATTLAAYPEIAAFAEAKVDAAFAPGRIKALYARMSRRAVDEPRTLAAAVQRLARRLQRLARPLTEIEARFLTLRGRYGDEDVGLFSLFLLNLVHLERGEALYTEAGVPHAYLGGDIVECMANSDNVVRAGLTPKYKDVETLVEILKPVVDAPLVEGRSQDGEIIYRTPASEFQVSRRTFAEGETWEAPRSGGPELYLVTEGVLDTRWGAFERGASFFVPAALVRLRLVAQAQSELFRVRVPQS